MGALSDPQHELFAQGLAKGLTADKAYQKAGYKANRGNAARLNANENVLARVTELLEKGATKAVWTIKDAIRYAEEVLETPVGDVDHNHRLCQERTYIEGQEETSVKIKMVGKESMFDKLCKIRGWYAAEKVEGSLNLSVSPAVEAALNKLLA